MKVPNNYILILLITLSFNVFVFHQSQAVNHQDSIIEDTLTIVKSSIFGIKIYQKEKLLSMNDLVNICTKLPQAKKWAQKAKLTYVVFTVTGVLGLAILGASTKGNAPGEVAYWPATGIGAMILSSSFLLYKTHIKQIEQAIYNYNHKL